MDSLVSNGNYKERLNFALNRVHWQLQHKIQLRGPWNMSIHRIKQQCNNYDCGVFTLMVFDYLSDGLEPIAVLPTPRIDVKEKVKVTQKETFNPFKI